MCPGRALCSHLALLGWRSHEGLPTPALNTFGVFELIYAAYCFCNSNNRTSLKKMGVTSSGRSSLMSYDQCGGPARINLGISRTPFQKHSWLEEHWQWLWHSLELTRSTGHLTHGLHDPRDSSVPWRALLLAIRHSRLRSVIPKEVSRL